MGAAIFPFAVSELRIVGGTVVTPRGTRVTDVVVRDGRIVRVGKARAVGEAVSARGLVVLPGAVDAHVHLDLPVAGTRSADDFASGTLAAACGGVTTIIDFTVGAPGLSLPAAVERRLSDAQAAVVDYALHVELVGWTPDRVHEIFEVAELGLRSFGEIFMTYSETNRRTPLGHMKVAMEAIRKIGGTAMVHAETDELVQSERGPYPAARPALAEETAIAQVGALAKRTGCRTCIAHISSAQGLSALLAARKQGAPILGETCPQYLLLDERVYARKDGHLFSVVPPLRTEEDQQALWAALEAGELDLVSTDHCPFTRAQKDAHRDEPAKLPSGLPGVETLLPLLYSEGVGKGRIPLAALPRLLSEGPARAFGLWPRKGALRAGADADLVLLDPAARWTIQARDLHMATDFSPYEGWAVQGRVVGVLSRGEWLVRDGEILARPGRGVFIPWQGGTVASPKSASRRAAAGEPL